MFRSRLLEVVPFFFRFTVSMGLIVAVLLPEWVVFAATKTSAGNCNWNAAACWAPSGVPVAGDDVIIAAGNTVTVNANTANLASLTVNGTLVIGNNTTARTVNVSNGAGNLTIAAGGTIIPNNPGSVVNHTLNVGGNFTNNGTFTAVNGNGNINVVLNGANAARTLGGSSTTTFRNLTLTPTAAATINISPATNLMNVTTTLTVNANAALSPAAAVVINNAAPAGTITGAGTILVTRTAATADYTNQYRFTTNTLTSMGVNYAGAGDQSINPFTYGRLLTSGGSGTKTLGGNVVVNTTLTVGAGTTLDTAANNITVTGATTVNGTLTHGSITGTKQFTGLVTVAAGGTWNNSGNAAINFRGGLTNNGAAFTAGTGIYTFSTNNQAMNGTSPVTIPNITVTGVTLTNNANLTVTTALAGTGGLTNAAAGILNINFMSPVGITTLTATAVGNTVNYNAAGAQTVRAVAYSNLTLSGSGVKTLTGVATVGRDLTLSGTAEATTAANLTVGRNLSAGAGTTLTVAGFNITVTGATSVSGTLSHSSATGATKRYTGLVTINAGGVWNNSGNAAINFRGGLTHNGAAFTAGTGIQTFTTNAQAIGGTSAIAIPRLTVTGVTLTNNSAVGLTAGTALAGTGNLTQSANSVLNIGGTSTITTLNATAVGNIVNYSGAAQTIKAATYYNLRLSGSGTKTLGAAASVANGGALNIDGVTFASGGFLTMNTTSSIAMNNGSMTGNLVGGGVYDVTYTGNSATTGTELSGTGLGNVTVNLTAGQTLTLNQNRAPDGNLSVTSGIFDLSTFTINRSAAGGTAAVSNDAVLGIGGTNGFPANYTVHTLGATSTVEYGGTAQTVSVETYGNLNLSGSGLKSMSGATSIGANTDISGTAVANIGAGLTIPADSLSFAGVGQASGSWGSTTSAATHTNDTFFSATTGMLNVATNTAANTTPTVSASITDVSVLEDAVNTVFSLYPNFADAEDADALLTYTVTGNTTPGLFTAVTITDPTNFTLDYAPNANGTSNITIRATDTGGLFVEDTFLVTVTAVNDEPNFTAVDPPAVDEDAGAQGIAGWYSSLDFGPADEDASQSVFTYSTGFGTCGTLLSAGPSPTPFGGLNFTPAPNQNGTCTFSASFRDDGGVANGGDDTSPSQSFTITVNAVNDAPSFAKGADQTVDEDAGAQTVSGWATAVNDGDPELTQTLTFNVTGNTNAGLFSAGPSIDATSGDLTYTPAANVNGSASITITLSDDGNNTSPNVNTSAGQSFVINVTAVNDAPSFTKGADQTVDEDAGAQTVSGWATAVDDGEPELTQTLTFNVTGNTNAGLFSAGPAIDATTGDLTYTPAVNANGSASITITLSDDGSNTSPNVNTSAGQSFVINVTAVNDAPSFTAVDPPAVTINSGAQTVSSWAIFNPGPNEASQSVAQYNISNSACGTLLSAGPSVSTTGTLTYTPATDQAGSCTFDVTVRDDGGTANGGTDTNTPAQTFTITVGAPVITLSPAILPNGILTFAYSQTITASGGAGPYTFAVTAGALPTGLTLTAAGVLSGIPTALGIFNFTVTATDSSGGSGPFTGSRTYSITINNGVAVTIEQAVGQLDPTNASPINFTVVFGAATANFATGDVTISGTAGATTAIVTGGGTTYNAAVSGMTGNGTVIASIAAGVATDASGNPNFASTSTDNSVAYDSVAPTVTINQAVGQVDPTSDSPLTFTVVFSETVTGFTPADVNFTGSTVGGTLAANVSGAGPTYTVSVTGMTTSGNVVVSIPANAAIDSVGNNSLASASIDNTVSYTIDNVPPLVVSSLRADPDPASVVNIHFIVTFSEPVTGVDVSDFSLATTGVAGAVVTVVGGSGSVYTVTVNAGSNDGTIRLDVLDNDSIRDAFVNPLGAGFTNGQTYTIVNKSPIFADVPYSYWANSHVERLYNAGITGGCGTNPLIYCPDDKVTRAQMAVFLLRTIHGASYAPPPATGIVFGDVPASHWAAAWIEALYQEGITEGCGVGIYCPEEVMTTRAQMAVFLLKARHGRSYTPPAPGGIFNDVPVDHWAAAWIEQLAAEGITSSCGGGNYCPDASLTRAEMAVFLVKSLYLPKSDADIRWEP